MKCSNCGHENTEVEVEIQRELVKRYVIRFESISDEDLERLGLKARCADGHIQLDLKPGTKTDLIVQEIKHKYQTVVVNEYSFSNEYV